MRCNNSHITLSLLCSCRNYKILGYCHPLNYAALCNFGCCTQVESALIARSVNCETACTRPTLRKFRVRRSKRHKKHVFLIKKMSAGSPNYKKKQNKLLPRVKGQLILKALYSKGPFRKYVIKASVKNNLFYFLKFQDS